MPLDEYKHFRRENLHKLVDSFQGILDTSSIYIFVILKII